jgi:hypothetical protein
LILSDGIFLGAGLKRIKGLQLWLGAQAILFMEKEDEEKMRKRVGRKRKRRKKIASNSPKDDRRPAPKALVSLSCLQSPNSTVNQ